MMDLSAPSSSLQPTPPDNDDLFRDLEADAKDWNDFWMRMKPKLEAKRKVSLECISLIDLGKPQSGESVKSELEQAIVKIGSTNKVTKGLKAFVARIGKKSEAIDVWLSLLPRQSHYTSIIGGGFKILLTAAAAYSNIRDAIVDCLAIIPDYLEKAMRRVSIHQSNAASSVKLRQKCREIFACVVDIFKWIFTWLSRGSLQRFGQTILKLSSVDKDLQEKLETLEHLCSDSKDESSLLTEATIHKTSELVGQILVAVQKTDQTMSRETEQLEDAAYQLLTQYTNRIDLAESNIMDELKSIVECLKHIVLFMSSNDGSGFTESTSQARPGRPISKGLVEPTSQSLAKPFEMDTEKHQQSLIQLQRLSIDMNPSNKSIARQLLQHPTLCGWIQARSSTALYVDGRQSYERDDLSIAFATAQLTLLLQASSTSETAVIFFISGPRPSSESPSGILRTFIAQLIECKTTCSLGLSALAELRTEAEITDTARLQEVFIDLVRQLPLELTLFCILSDVDKFSRLHREELDTLLSVLALLAADEQVQAAVKVLVTSSKPGRGLSSILNFKETGSVLCLGSRPFFSS